MDQDTIRARSIELVNERGDVGMKLTGGGGESEPGIIIYGPNGPQSALAMFVKREDLVPQIIINRAGGGTVLITVDGTGPLVYLQGEDGSTQEIRP